MLLVFWLQVLVDHDLIDLIQRGNSRDLASENGLELQDEAEVDHGGRNGDRDRCCSLLNNEVV